MREGKHLPDTPTNPYPRWPVWCAVEAVTTGLGGDTLGVIRLPAALAGILSVGIAFLAGRALAGSAAGLGAAGFLMGSFWHLQYSRMAPPCIFSVTEGLLAAWILLGRPAPGMAAGCGLAVLCVAAPYGYAASLITPFVVALLLAVRWYGAPQERPSKWFVIAIAIGAGVLAAGYVLWRPASLQRVAEVAAEHRNTFGGEVFAWLKSVCWSTAPTWGFWGSYPPGAPRFSSIELVFIVAGAIALWWSGSLSRWRKWGWTGLAVLTILPEWSARQGPNLLRGLPQLAPAAVAAGVAVAALARRTGRYGLALAIALLVANAGMTAHRLVVRFARDPLVA